MSFDPEATTPYRSTKITFDTPIQSLKEDAWSETRMGGDVNRAVAGGARDDSNAPNIRYWPNGAWTLEPIQERIANIHEQITYVSLTVSAPQWRLAAQVKEVNLWRSPIDLPGVSADVVVAATGDPWLVRHIAAGGSYASDLVPSQPGPTWEVDFVMDRMGESIETFPADQGFFLRWYMPGTGMHNPDYAWTFYFGQYCVSIRGDGFADLWEYAHQPDEAATWKKRATFRYCLASRISSAYHTLVIWPHFGMFGDKYIAFSGGQLDAGAYIAGFPKSDINEVAPTQYVYEINEITRNGDVDAAPEHVTSPNRIMYDVRRDLKLRLQVSRLGFHTGGTLITLPCQMPAQMSNVQNPAAQSYATKPTGTNILADVKDSDSGSTFNIATGDRKPYVEFTFTGDGTNTPVLWGFSIRRDQVTEAIAPGSFTGGGIRNVELITGGGDPSLVGGVVDIEDPGNLLPGLRVRGQFAVDLAVDAIISGTPQTVHLLRGYINRPRAKRKGRQYADGSPLYQGGFGTGFKSDWPSPDWHGYSCPLQGQWLRLARKVNGPMFRYYVQDPTQEPDSTGLIPPWKVTDVIVDVLRRVGYPDSMILIPDVAIRMWPGATTTPAEWTLQPNTDFAQLLTTLCRNYLGANLAFDDNAGTDGAWILIFGTQVGTPPVAAFTTHPPNGGYSRILPHVPGAYAANTFPIFDLEESYTVPPEFNCVHVYCPVVYGITGALRFNAEMHNPYSYNVPGFTITADPTHPDYLGEKVELKVCELGAIAPTPEETQANVDWTCARLFDFTCHGQILQPFLAPLAFILDSVTLKYRPLRYQDPILVNGVDYLIKNLTPRYQSDFHQMASYEAIIPQV